MTLTLIVTCIKLFAQVLTEYFAWKKRKDAEEKQYNLDMKAFREIVNKSLDQLTTEARQDSAQARDVEDQVDAELRNKPPGES